MMIDKHSPTWLAIERWAQDNLATSRTVLEVRDLGPVPSEYERGRIQALKDLLDLAKDKPSYRGITAD